jgi:hypothetical protein
MTCSLDQWLKELVPFGDIELLTLWNLELSPDGYLCGRHSKYEVEIFQPEMGNQKQRIE